MARHVFLVSLMLLTTHQMCGDRSSQLSLSGPLVLTNEWTELKPSTPLEAHQDQLILLDLKAPFKYDADRVGVGPNQGSGILVPSGRVINPEIEVFDEHGTRYSFVLDGARQRYSPVYSLPYPEELPRDKRYVRIRIRSEVPIECNAIYWFSDAESRK